MAAAMRSKNVTHLEAAKESLKTRRLVMRRYFERTINDETMSLVVI
jgi:hypothetical protein